MKVAELIEALSRLDPGLTVVAVGEGGRLIPLSGTVTAELVFEDERKSIDEPEVAGISLSIPCIRSQDVV